MIDLHHHHRHRARRALGGILFVLLSSPLQAGELLVPQDFATVQSAIVAAETFDEVVLDVGVYFEAIDLLGKSILVRSTDPGDPAIVASTIIDATGLGNSVVKCRSGETPSTQLSGLTFRGGSGSPDLDDEVSGGGLHIFQSSPTVFDCRFESNATPEDGGAVYVDGGAPFFGGCLFIGNSSLDDGGAIAVRDLGSVTLSQCVFSGNSAADKGGAVRVSSGFLSVQGCAFVSNSAGEGGGMHINVDDVVTIAEGAFCGNSPDHVFGPYIDGGNNHFGSCDGDSDGDGLLDLWELVGLDLDEDGHYELTLPGADPDHKDIFVEVDAMQGFGMGEGEVAMLENAFADAPVQNPDGLPGINLHLFRNDVDLIHFPEWTTSNGCWPDTFELVKDEKFGVAGESDEAKEARARAYRYCIIADQATGGVGGCGETPGNDFVVFYGAILDESARAAAFMHELGHNLGLDHGGGDVINGKPNYPSIMNYAMTYPSTWNESFWKLDYSRADLGTLDEATLDETIGVGNPSGQYDFWRMPYGVTIDELGNRDIRFVRLDGSPTDYGDLAGTQMQDGMFDTGVLQDLNYIGDSPIGGTNESSPAEVLAGHDDWSTIQIAIPEGQNVAGTIYPEELTVDQIQWIDQNIPVPPCLADFDGNGAVDVPDLLQLLGSWGEAPPIDLDGNGVVDVLDLVTMLAQWGPCD